jgi:hypothetical protein
MGRLREAFARTSSKQGWAFWVVMLLTVLLLPLPIAVPLIASRLLRSPAGSNRSGPSCGERAPPIAITSIGGVTRAENQASEGSPGK